MRSRHTLACRCQALKLLLPTETCTAIPKSIPPLGMSNTLVAIPQYQIIDMLPVHRSSGIGSFSLYTVEKENNNGSYDNDNRGRNKQNDSRERVKSRT